MRGGGAAAEPYLKLNKTDFKKYVGTFFTITITRHFLVFFY